MRDTYGLFLWVRISVRETFSSDMDFTGAAPAAAMAPAPQESSGKFPLTASGNFVIFAISNCKKS